LVCDFQELYRYLIDYSLIERWQNCTKTILLLLIPPYPILSVGSCIYPAVLSFAIVFFSLKTISCKKKRTRLIKLIYF